MEPRRTSMYDLPMSSDYRFVYVTAPSRGEAQALGRQLVESRLAACANVIGGVFSTYWWEGRLEEAEEAVLILKTRVDRVESLVTRIRETHSYQCPCVVTLPIEEGNPAYLSWIDSSLDG